MTSSAKNSRYGSTDLRIGVDRAGVELLHELLASIRALDQELLVMAVELVELPRLAVAATSTSRAIDFGSRRSDGSVRRGRFEPGIRIDAPEELTQGLVGPERPCAIGSARDQLDPRGRLEPGEPALRARSTSRGTVSSSGVVNRPGAPPVPGGMTNSGPLAASTIRVRGAMSEATSASPNCSSRPKTFRSTGWRQTSLRSSK